LFLFLPTSTSEQLIRFIILKEKP